MKNTQNFAAARIILLLWVSSAALSSREDQRSSKETARKGVGCSRIFTYFLLHSSGLKARSNVISYVTVNDSPDSDSSLSSPYSTDTLSALRGNSGPLVEAPGRVVGEGAGTRTIIVPPLKTQLGDCTVATQASGECLHGCGWILLWRASP